jgi:starvation-inducible DNA-binding protein
LRSIGDIAGHQRIRDNDTNFVAPGPMLRELMQDNKDMIGRMREAHAICDKYNDVATASLLENFIDAAEKRNWFLFEAGRSIDPSGH